MVRITGIAAFSAAVSLVLGGCVSMGKYELKEKEVVETSRSLKDLQGRYEALSRENGSLKERIERLDADNAGLVKERDVLKEDNEKLNDLLKAKTDALSDEISKLRQSNSDLENQNVRLKDDLAGIQKAKSEEVQETSRIYEEMLEKLKNEISQGQVTISELKGKLTVNLVDPLLFDSGKVEVKPAGLAALQKVTDILKTVKGRPVRVEGYTDYLQKGGSQTRKYPSNWELSAARAVNVTRFLQQQGMEPSMLSAVAHGEYHPVASNDSEEGKAKNSRIEIVLLPVSSP